MPLAHRTPHPDPPSLHFSLSQDTQKAKQFLPFLQRAGRSEAVVEYVFSGSRLKLFMPKETCLITFLLAGEPAPPPAGCRIGPLPDGGGGPRRGFAELGSTNWRRPEGSDTAGGCWCHSCALPAPRGAGSGKDALLHQNWGAGGKPQERGCGSRTPGTGTSASGSADGGASGRFTPGACPCTGRRVRTPACTQRLFWEVLQKLKNSPR